MKNTAIFIFLFSFILIAQAQTSIPSSFNVQFSIRTISGKAVINKPAKVQILLSKTGNSGFYNKIITTTSNAFGIYNITVSGAGSNGPFPSAEDFASGAITLEVRVDTTTNNTFFTIYDAQAFASVPYAIAAQKAPGTVEYQFDNSESGDPTKGINKDILFQNDLTDANFFPRLFFNKQNNTWPATANSYSLLPNKPGNLYRTIFFDFTANPTLKPRWAINQALTMNNFGLGINIPGGNPPNKALDVYGAIKFDTLKNALPADSNRFITTDNLGNLKLGKVQLINSTIPSLWNLNNVGLATYITPTNANHILQVSKASRLPAAIFNMTSDTNTVQIFSGNQSTNAFQSGYPTLFVENRTTSLNTTLAPIGLEVKTKFDNRSKAILVNGGYDFTDLNNSGMGILAYGGIAVRGIGSGFASPFNAIGGYFSASGSRSAALVTKGSLGSSGLIVTEGNSGFGFNYTNGSTSTEKPRSTVDINGTMGMKAAFIVGNSSLNVNGFDYALSDSASIVYVSDLSFSAAAKINIKLDDAFKTPNRIYDVYINRVNNFGSYNFTNKNANVDIIAMELLNGLTGFLTNSTFNFIGSGGTLDPTIPINVKVRLVSTYVQAAPSNGIATAGYYWVLTRENYE